MTRPVVFSPEAKGDLCDISLYIASQAGAGRALAYLDRIEAHCLGLSGFPERGRSRGDLYPGLRTTAFSRRVTVAYLVAADRVTILRILYGGRDLAGALAAGV